jgi:hypothetical protein
MAAIVPRDVEPLDAVRVARQDARSARRMGIRRNWLWWTNYMFTHQGGPILFESVPAAPLAYHSRG